MVEILGGVIMGGLAIIKPATFLYLGTQIWYGNVIPSCYLINSSDIKDYIMDKGWWNGFSKIYNKRERKDDVRKNSTKNYESHTGKNPLSKKSRVFPEPSACNPNNIEMGKRKCDKDTNNSVNSEVNNKRDQEVFLHDLDGIQASQCIHENIKFQKDHTKSEAINHSKNKWIKNKGDEKKTAIFDISNNSSVRKLSSSDRTENIKKGKECNELKIFTIDKKNSKK